MDTEAELLNRCRTGDSLAWNELFDRHYAAAARFVCQLDPGFTKEDIEEVCQETFLSVVRKLDSFAGHCQFQTWLFRIASNKAHDHRQRRLAAKRGGGQTIVSLHADSTSELPLDPPSTAPGPDGSLMNAERMQLVRDGLDQLGDPCRELIELRYFGDLSYEEIAFMLNLNQKTVSSRLSKCLDRLEPILNARFALEDTTPFSV